MHYQNDVLLGAREIEIDAARRVRCPGDFRNRVVRLLEFARRAGIPVVSVRIAFRPDHADVIQNCPIFRDVVENKALVEGSFGAEFHDGLGPLEGEFVVKHTRINAFHGSQLLEVLTCLDAKRIILAGVSTNSVVTTTAGAAADMGYEIIVAGDACSTAERALHDYSLENMKPIAEVLGVDDLIARLEERSAG